MEVESFGTGSAYTCTAGLVGIDFDRCLTVYQICRIGFCVGRIVIPVDAQIAGVISSGGSSQGKLHILGRFAVEIDMRTIHIVHLRSAQCQ